MLPEFDELKYFLGSICKRGHDWNETGHSLRTIGKRDCFDCDRMRKASQKKPKKQREVIDDINGNYLGKLCVRGHDYNGTGKTLRYANRQCIKCQQLKNKLYPILNPENRERINQKYKQPGKAKAARLQRIDRLKAMSANGKTFLGKLCPKQHDHLGTGQSLKYACSGRCVECSNTGSKRLRRNLKLKLQSKPAAVTDTYYLGALCPEGHDYDGTQRSLRYKSVGVCVQCRKESGLRHRKNSPNYKKNDLRRRLARKVREGNIINIATYEEIEQLKEYFGNACCYCGSTHRLAIDHFLPVSKGGNSTTGNLVLACNSCNSSKKAEDPIEWFQTRSSYSKRKLDKILKYLGKSLKNYNQIPLI